MTEVQIRDLLTQLEAVEIKALKFHNADTTWTPPGPLFMDEFHRKNDSLQESHPVEYQKRKEVALRQEVTMLQTLIRIATRYGEDGGTVEELIGEWHVGE